MKRETHARWKKIIDLELCMRQAHVVTFIIVCGSAMQVPPLHPLLPIWSKGIITIFRQRLRTAMVLSLIPLNCARKQTNFGGRVGDFFLIALRSIQTPINPQEITSLSLTRATRNTGLQAASHRRAAGGCWPCLNDYNDWQSVPGFPWPQCLPFFSFSFYLLLCTLSLAACSACLSSYKQRFYLRNIFSCTARTRSLSTHFPLGNCSYK